MIADKTTAALLKEIMADEDPLGALERLHDGLRRGVFEQALKDAGWGLNAAARRLRRTASTVTSALTRSYPDLLDEAERLADPAVRRGGKPTTRRSATRPSSTGSGR